ncbi:hypothetical protein B8W69_02850 [Mycobacterium vulneris]|uniref:4Fe-4S Wbl-type domain-containing protein n=1 Tax=Mycolicibacterium vulneris TaxID=547163 RepID=A0A1X2LDH4_9MYCO|nr:hypothetical protein B8W69_02850 [Mycolicibacterium vulneris]
MTNWEHMSALVGGIPDLRAARCKGRADLFEATVAVRRIDGGSSRNEVNAARVAALRLCAACTALEQCRAWLATLRPTRRPRGVVAGQVITSTGLPLGTRTMSTAGAVAADGADS